MGGIVKKCALIQLLLVFVHHTAFSQTKKEKSFHSELKKALEFHRRFHNYISKQPTTSSSPRTKTAEWLNRRNTKEIILSKFYKSFAAILRSLNDDDLLTTVQAANDEIADGNDEEKGLLQRSFAKDPFILGLTTPTDLRNLDLDTPEYYGFLREINEYYTKRFTAQKQLKHLYRNLTNIFVRELERGFNDANLIKNRLDVSTKNKLVNIVRNAVSIFKAHPSLDAKTKGQIHATLKTLWDDLNENNREGETEEYTEKASKAPKTRNQPMFRYSLRDLLNFLHFMMESEVWQRTRLLKDNKKRKTKSELTSSPSRQFLEFYNIGDSSDESRVEDEKVFSELFSREEDESDEHKRSSRMKWGKWTPGIKRRLESNIPETRSFSGRPSVLHTLRKEEDGQSQYKKMQSRGKGERLRNVTKKKRHRVLRRFRTNKTLGRPTTRSFLHHTPKVVRKLKYFAFDPTASRTVRSKKSKYRTRNKTGEKEEKGLSELRANPVNHKPYQLQWFKLRTNSESDDDGLSIEANATILIKASTITPKTKTDKASSAVVKPTTVTIASTTTNNMTTVVTKRSPKREKKLKSKRKRVTKSKLRTRKTKDHEENPSDYTTVVSESDLNDTTVNNAVATTNKSKKIKKTHKSKAHIKKKVKENKTDITKDANPLSKLHHHLRQYDESDGISIEVDNLKLVSAPSVHARHKESQNISKESIIIVLNNTLDEEIAKSSTDPFESSVSKFNIMLNDVNNKIKSKFRRDDNSTFDLIVLNVTETTLNPLNITAAVITKVGNSTVVFNANVTNISSDELVDIVAKMAKVKVAEEVVKVATIHLTTTISSTTPLVELIQTLINNTDEVKTLVLRAKEVDENDTSTPVSTFVFNSTYNTTEITTLSSTSQIIAVNITETTNSSNETSTMEVLLNTTDVSCTLSSNGTSTVQTNDVKKLTDKGNSIKVYEIDIN